MAQLSDSVLSQLNEMDEYDRLLALDRVARENNLTVDQVKAQLQAFQQGGSQTISNPSYDEMINPAPSQPGLGQHLWPASLCCVANACGDPNHDETAG